MIIKETSFNYYGVLLVLSIFIGITYVLYRMIKGGYKNKKNLLLYMLLYIFFTLFFGKLFTIFASGGKENILNAGFSSYGGVVGIIIVSIIYEKIIPMNNKLVKYSIPLSDSIPLLLTSIVRICLRMPSMLWA